MKTQETLDDQEMMLKELCSLLPLAVSTEYLFDVNRVAGNSVRYDGTSIMVLP
ncbi:hypothetical protein HDV64DRAFT_247927 [Trichoderma sp. TUCIM 5745]